MEVEPPHNTDLHQQASENKCNESVFLVRNEIGDDK